MTNETGPDKKDTKKKITDYVRNGFLVAARGIRRAVSRVGGTVRRLWAFLRKQAPGGDAADDGAAAGGDAILSEKTIVFAKPGPADKSAEEKASVFMEVKRKRLGIEILSMTMRLILITVLILCVSGAGAAVGVVNAYIGMSPELDLHTISVETQGSKLFDANGALITTYSGTVNRIYTKLEDIPKQLQDAFIATEDIRFFDHEGVDIKRLFSAIMGNLTNTSTSGGSTITQQLIKNRMLSPERTLKRKTQEAYLALMLEKELSKNQILEAYLNTINLGSGNYDVASAATDYFGKTLDRLTLRECATIAGLTQAPHPYNPRKNYYERNTPERTDQRTDTVLKRMYEGGFITKKQYEAALKEKLHVVKDSIREGIYDMPHFVEYAISDVITHFLEQRGLPDTKQNRTAVENEIRTSGYQIHTTVDPDIQHTVEQSLANWSYYPRLVDPTKNKITYKNPDGSTYEVKQPQAAAVVLDQHNGQIKAIVGSRDVPQQMKTYNRAADGSMPVGSSIKPLTVYGPALDMGMTPSTLIYNTSERIPGWDSPSGRPSNYGEGSFTGATTMRTGLVKSYNIVAARLLMENVGLNDAYNYLISLGVNPKHINKTGAGLALGTSGLTPLEMAGGFAAIANEGEYIEPVSFTKVLDANGKVILDATKTQARRQVYKPSTAYQLVSMLEDAVRRGTGTRANISGQDVGGKTGTNESFRGVFFSGITGYYTATVWVGHDSYSPSFRYGTTGGGYAAPIWRDFMSKILKGKPYKKIISGSAEEYDLVRCTVCADTGLLAGKFCPHKQTEYFARGSVPNRTCTTHKGTEFNKEVNDYIKGVYDKMDDYGLPDNIRTRIRDLSEKLVDDIKNAPDKAKMDRLFTDYKEKVAELLEKYKATPEPTPTKTPKPTPTPTPKRTPKPTPKPSKTPSPASTND
ncbi:MAG: transglycosylase domain-containing protein [Christensenellales bacterium]|jgi:penicillin-binding protein 1A